MAQKKLGYEELVWTCPNCNTKNPGPEKMCLACGAPQPPDVQFEQKPQQELITDQAKIEQAKKGPDIHCPYCGARNVADAAICIRCGGDLKGGQKRESGKVVGAYKTEKEPVKEINCPSCGTKNPETNMTCSACGANLAELAKPEAAKPSAPAAGAKSNKWAGIVLGGILLLIILCVVVFIALSSKKEDVSGVVNSVQWSRSIPILDLQDVTHKDWLDDIPQEAVLGDCEKQYHHTQSEPEEGAEEVCGTPYSKDTGSGFAEVVQDCEYRVYDDYCQYTVQEWQVIDSVQLQGSDLNPQWPDVSLTGNQRVGDQEESYRIVFQTEKGNYTYVTSDEQLFLQCEPGSDWTLVINALGNVVSIEPK
ncbi:MAG: zinc ribbon domain-containing protein [Anaerolineales bacterium]|nr:zinc ribbon domain-containing protein [Anaerolineales bacterium]